MDPADLLTALADQEYATIITYKRDGRAVATPVWFVVVRGCVHFRTPANTGKVRRLRGNPDVSFPACTTRRRRRASWRG
jgi:PPOX class probable F420-dependent enzyme